MSAEHDPIFGCELATGRRDRDGYAFYGRTRAHIAAWTAEHGEIAEGMEIDHLCRRRHCKALHHLELVTRRENELRKSWRYRARRTLCPRGHELGVHGIVTPEGGRVCRRCNRDAKGGGIVDTIAEQALAIAQLPQRPPMTTEQALEQVATSNPEERIRELARRKLKELRGR